jgi:hypothetical protein
MKTTAIAVGIFIATINLFAEDSALNLDDKVIRTYEYMSNSKTFHYNGKVLNFPNYGVITDCIDKRLLKSETITKIDMLKEKIPASFKNNTCDGHKGYLKAKIVGLPDRGEYIFDRLEVLQ